MTTTTITRNIDKTTTAVPTERTILPYMVVSIESGAYKDEICWVRRDGSWLRGAGGTKARKHRKGSVVRIIGTAEPEFDDGHTPG